jgi:hypothetical protein
MQLPLKNTTATTEIDDEFAHLSKFKWRMIKKLPSRTLYAGARINGKVVMLHRLIFNPGTGFKTDHIDGNGLNNRRSNLRQATQSQNMANAGKFTNNTSGFKGIHRRQRRNYIHWRAEITFQGKRIFLGVRKDKMEAVKLYDDAAVKYFGAFGHPNFPENYPEIFGEKIQKSEV